MNECVLHSNLIDVWKRIMHAEGIFLTGQSSKVLKCCHHTITIVSTAQWNVYGRNYVYLLEMKKINELFLPLSRSFPLSIFLALSLTRRGCLCCFTFFLFIYPARFILSNGFCHPLSSPRRSSPFMYLFCMEAQPVALTQQRHKFKKRMMCV